MKKTTGHPANHIKLELMEYEILVNIKELLRKHLPILFIEFSPETLKDIYYLLRELGYKIFWFITVNEQYDLFLNYNYNVSQFTQGDINIVCFPNSYTDIPSFLEEVQEQEIQEIQHSFTHFIDPRNIFPSSTHSKNPYITFASPRVPSYPLPKDDEPNGKV